MKKVILIGMLLACFVINGLMAKTPITNLTGIHTSLTGCTDQVNDDLEPDTMMGITRINGK